MILLFAVPGLVQMLVTVLVALIVIALVWWLVNTLLPEPLKKYGLAVVVVVAVLFLIWALLSLTGGGGLKL